MVANEEGVHFARSIRRVPVEKRWEMSNLKLVKWAPWHRYKDARDADGEAPEGVPTEEVPEMGAGERTVFIDTKSKVPREFYISQEDCEKHGYTRGCGGCNTTTHCGMSRKDEEVYEK